MRRDRHRLGLMALGMVLLTGACAEPEPMKRGLTGGWITAGCEFVRNPETVTVGGRIRPATPPGLAAAIARIDTGGRHDHAASYAGIEVDQERVRAIVYRVPSAAFDDFIRLNAENTCIAVRDAQHPRTELTGWHERIVADLRTWQEQGIRISSVLARHDGAGVEISTRDVARARVEVPRRYGGSAPLIFVERGPAVPPATPGLPVVSRPGG
jgi:hypothetical protein